jgi:hypothetical protein
MRVNRIVDNVETLAFKALSEKPQFHVLSTYFTSKQDPVRGGHQANDNFEYIRYWYTSVQDHELTAVVFYDNLSQGFIEQYQTERIKFVKCQLGTLSLNDERFFIFQEFIQHLPDGSFVLTTDINDVVINKNPLPLFKSKPEKIFIGRGNRRVWKNGIWTLKVLWQFSRKYPNSLPVSFLDYPVFNPGTIAGRKDKVLGLFEKMVQVFEILADDQNYDMQVFNHVLKEEYFPKPGKWDKTMPFALGWNFWYYAYRIQRKLENAYRKEKYDLSSYQESIEENEYIYAGFPFVSMFSWYEETTEAYLIHK